MQKGKAEDLSPYFSGEKLYGDDFSPEEIAGWYEAEEEGYSSMGNDDQASQRYEYYSLNHVHGFRHIKSKQPLGQVLGFGSAWGLEFLPYTDQISQLTIVDPSEAMRSESLNHLRPKYVKAQIDGTLDFPDASFDLVCCFGVLHHVANVSHVLEELLRVLKSGGHLLLREPIISMGDWRQARPGLTKCERGIPVSHFEKIFSDQGVEVLHRGFCFTLTYQLQKLLGKFFRKPLYSYKTYIRLDAQLSKLLQHNVRYHATRKINRIAPTSVFFVIRKD